MSGTRAGLRLRDYWEFARLDLSQMKLRAFLTAFGVAVGVGALIAMVGFGTGLQKNITESFTRFDLFNSITVLPEGAGLFRAGDDPDDGSIVRKGKEGPGRNLDDGAVALMRAWPGVASVFPEIRFPAVVRFRGREEFRLVQVVPADIAASGVATLAAGRIYRDDEEALILTVELLRGMGIKEPAEAVGEKVEIRSIAFDFSAFNPMDMGGYLAGRKLPFRSSTHVFTVAGVAGMTGFGDSTPFKSDILLPSGAAARIEKLPFSNIWDLFRAGEGRGGYSAVNIRAASPQNVGDIQKRVREMGFETFALVDQFQQIKTGFLFMDMVLAAVGMVAIFVAALGIINTMVMSVLERYGEIGIMKAVGAASGDIRRVFFFESGTIGLFGGFGGLALGWGVSRIINRVVNYFASRQGVPPFEYFHFPLWLMAGAIVFAVVVSLVAGIYPAHRAARVDPAVALRHE